MKFPGADAQVRPRYEPEPSVHRQRIDVVSAEERALIADFVARHGVTELPPGQFTDLPTGPATPEYRDAMRRKAQRDQKFRNLSDERGGNSREPEMAFERLQAPVTKIADAPIKALVRRTKLGTRFAN